MIESGQLRVIMPDCPLPRAQEFTEPINDAMVAFGIDQTQARVAAFLAQVAQESGELKYVREIASGNAYEGRADLGNTEPGDGPRFKGRGLIQITGRKNYAACSLALLGAENLLLDNPEILELPNNAADSAGWFWQSHGLSDFADVGDFETITRKINGGLTGYVSRAEYWRRAKIALGLT